MKPSRVNLIVIFCCVLGPVILAEAGEDWLQYKKDFRHSGDVVERSVSVPLELMGAVGLTDAIFTAPVISDGKIYVVDGSGAAFCVDAETFETVWKFQSRGGKSNCNNVSSPLLAGGYLHFGTTAGSYYVLNASTGEVVREIRCGDPIFSTPVAYGGRVYFASLGSRVFALKADGTKCWEWDFVKEELGFEGDRWDGNEWNAHGGRATWEKQFCCSRNIAHDGKMLVVPAGGVVIWLEDMGDKAQLRGKFLGGPRESPSTLGLSIGPEGEIYRQWTRRDNGGRVEVLELVDGEVKADWVRGTETSYTGEGSIGFGSVSVRGGDVYRCRPEEGFGFCLHRKGEAVKYLGGYPSIAPPILLKDSAVFGGLDGSLYVVPLSGEGQVWSFKTRFGMPITAPASVCDGKIYFGCEDGYLYVLGPEGRTKKKLKDLELWKVRSKLGGKYTGAGYDWYTNFGNFANTNQNEQAVKSPFKMKWVRRYEGTVKHFSVCGGGRMYTHTAEGQIFAVEQETGRQLWRRYFPGVHVSYTAPLYYDGRLYVPQAGLKKCRLRCLDAATGELIWEAPFTGSPSWNRQLPPIIYKNLVIYQFSTGEYTAKEWLFEHQSTFGFPEGQKPLVRAWDKDTGKEVWTRDFSEYGSGGDDAGMCLMDGVLYYSCYFGDKKPQGVTAAIEPLMGDVIWTTTEYSTHAGCTVSGRDGRIYLGGYNPVEDDTNRVWCLDAKDGSLVWKSEPVLGAIHVITIGNDFLFTHVQYRHGYLIDKENGKILGDLTKGYRCTRFTLSEPYLFGANMNIHDLSQKGKLIYAGPAIDVLQCVGGFVSNGRIFYTTNGGGLQSCLVYSDEAESYQTPWN